MDPKMVRFRVIRLPPMSLARARNNVMMSVSSARIMQHLRTPRMLLHGAMGMPVGAAMPRRARLGTIIPRTSIP